MLYFENLQGSCKVLLKIEKVHSVLYYIRDYNHKLMDYEEASKLLIMCSSFDRFQTFLKIKDELNDKDYWRILAYVYTCSDNLYYLKEEVKEAFLEDRSEREYLMNKNELKVYNSLPENIIIYRGMTSMELECRDFGVSWTLSKERAEFFAFKYGRNYATENKPKVVHQLEVKKVEILAYFNERNEQEVIYIQ